MARGPARNRSQAKSPARIIFDGSNISAMAREASSTIVLKGYSVSDTDVGKILVIRGGTNFVIGAYLIWAIDPGSNSWKLDRVCTRGVGEGMAGIVVHQEGRWHNPVLEYYQGELPNNPGQGEARQQVLKALHLIQPGVLKSLASRCLKRTLLEPEIVGEHDWCGPFGDLLWGHVRDAGQIVPRAGWVALGNLKPLRDALTRWAKDKPRRRWDLCDSRGEPIDWVADAAVQTLVWWHRKGQLPKKLRWQNLDFHCYGSLDGDEAVAMFEMARHFDAGSGFVRVAPEHAAEFSRLSDRAQRSAKAEYRSLGKKLGLTRMQNVPARYLEWYTLQTFLGFKLRKIRERELGTTRKGGTGIGVGDPENPDDLSAISHGIKKVADLVGFRR